MYYINGLTSTIILVGITSTVAMTPVLASGGKGMTWGKYHHDATLGIDRVGCFGLPLAPTKTGGCEPYIGDTNCKAQLPVLCINVDKSPRPNYAIVPSGGVMPDEFYNGWAGGHIATTLPTLGTDLTIIPIQGPIPGVTTTGDQICEKSFGSGWRMAEHHDGQYILGMSQTAFYGNSTNSPSPWPTSGLSTGGWTVYAWGNVLDTQRYWVKIDDQPANCWNP